MSNPLFARVPVGRNLLNSNSDYGRNYFNSEEPWLEEPHDITMRLLGREPTPDEVGARMMNALQRGAAPGYNPENPPTISESNYWPMRTLARQIDNAWSGEGRREEGISELPLNVQIGGKDTWIGAKMGLARDNDRAMDDIAKAQLPGAEFRRDRWNNLIVRLPDDATVSEAHASGSAFDQSSLHETRQRPIGGQEFYVNRPGFSGQDVVNWSVGQVPGLAHDAVVVAAKRHPLGALLWGAAANMGANVSLDKTAEKAGSRRGVDYLRAVEEGQDELFPSFLDFADWVKKTRK